MSILDSFRSGWAVRSAPTGLVALLLVAGCGGGGSNSVTAPSRAFTQGTIAGFGSIIVNGVRFGDSAANVVDDEDQAHGRDVLKLGMTVEIESDHVRAGSGGSSASAEARHIRFGSEIVGRVSEINNTTTAKTLTVLDQIVEVTDRTVFDDGLAGGLTAVHVDDIVEIHALFDTTSGHYIAKRIELEPGATVFKLRGTVSVLDTTKHTFKIGNAVINYSGVAPADLPNNFAEGLKVRVRLQTTQNSDKQWVAVTIRSGVRKVEDHDEAEVRGIITEFTDITTFKIGDLLVKTDGNTKFPDGTNGIVKGANVEVEGAIVGNTLMATKVELEDQHANDNRHGIDLHGPVKDLNKDTQTFTVRGVRVHYNIQTTAFAHGTVADLANDKAVEVRGKLADDGVTVEAMLIMFE